MKTRSVIAAMAACLCLATIPSIGLTNGNSNMNDGNQSQWDRRPNVRKPKMQVVFLLDATGSMSGLIGAAKDQIWSIASSLTQTRPEPDLEIGMIFYRDRGDDFVTRQIALGKSMDNLYEQLMAMQASGGGDGPESVNQALWESISDMQWDRSPNTYKAVFLVGDFPPHMDYQDDVKYHTSCAEAKKRGIIVNTILMGDNRETGIIWRTIAQRTGGEFVQTDMNANNITIYTPYDKKISDLQYELDKTRIYYGSAKAEASRKMVQSEEMREDVAANTKRAGFSLSRSGKEAYFGSYELVNDLENGKSLSEIKTSELPENMQKMTVSEREKYVRSITVKRETIVKEIARLNNERQNYIDAEMEKMDEEVVENSFDNLIFKAVKSQAAEKEIVIEGKVKK